MSDAEVTAARGAASLYLASVISLLLNTIYLILLTNILPQQQVGVVTLLNVLVIGIATASALAIPVIGAGLSATPPAVTRYLAQYIQSGNGRAALRVLEISLAVCAAISITLGFVLTRGLAGTPTKFAAIDGVVFALGQVGVYSLIGTERAGRAGIVLIISAAIRYAVSSGLLIGGFGPAGVFQGFIVGDAFLAVAAVALAAYSIPRSGSPRTSRSLLGYMLIVLAAGLIGFGVSQSDRLLAFFQRGLGDLAVYNIAAVGAAIAAFAPISVTNVLVPILGSLGQPGSPGRKRIMRSYTRYVGLVALPVGFGLAAIARPLLVLFGTQYVQGAPLLSVMAVAIGLTSVSAVYASSVLASGKTYLFLAANVFGLISLLVLAYFLVPYVGLMGIALARAGMLVATLTGFSVFTWLLGELVLDVKGYTRSLLSSVFMFVLLYTVVIFVSPHLFTRLQNVIFAVVLMPLGLILFIVPMRLVNAFGTEDFDFLDRLVPSFMRPVTRLLRRIFLNRPLT